MTNGCETWKLSKQTENSLGIAQRAMKRMMLRATPKMGRQLGLEKKNRSKTHHTGGQTTEMEVG